MGKIEELKAINAELSKQASVNDAAALASSREPFPGPLKDVYALDPDEIVGPYRVRPCYDYDLRVLSLANHPVYDLVVRGDGTKEFLPVDNNGRFLAWLFTTDVRTVKARIESEKLEACRKSADAMFEFVQPRVLMAVCNAAVDQIVKSIQPQLDYKTASIEGEAAKANLPPSHHPLTASAG